MIKIFVNLESLFLPFIDQSAITIQFIWLYGVLLENSMVTVHIMSLLINFCTWKLEKLTASPETLELSGIKLWLGGFHLFVHILLAHIISIGYIMDRSGIKETLKVIYASFRNSVHKMLNGHAYVQAIKAHTLLYLA